MKALTLEEIKSVSLEGLVYLRDLLEEHHLRYYLACGTLLGAVRHQGFIPWDDDIDIWMPRKDYETLLLKMGEFENDKWEIMHYSNNRKYLVPWAKLVNKKTLCKPSGVATRLCIGLSIDIFPLDYINLSMDQTMKELDMTVSRLFVQLESYHPSVIDVKSSIFKRIGHYLFFYLKCIVDRPYQTVMKEYDKALENGDETAETTVDYISAERFIFDTKWFGEGTKMVFENEQFVAPSHYDKVLSVCYGDYMSLPPVEQRVTNHAFGTFWL